MVVKIYWGYYSFNTKTNIVKRIKSGMGTYIGRKLIPYQPNGSEKEFFNPSVNGKRYSTTISKLRAKHA